MERTSSSKKIKLFDRDIALALGLNEAIVISQLEYWLSKNEKRNVNYKNGRYWTFNSIQKWHERVFYFWSESTVRRIFASLEEKGIILVANFNKYGFDRTKWYSLDYQKLDEIVRENLIESKNEIIEDYCDTDEEDLCQNEVGLNETNSYQDEVGFGQNESNTCQNEESFGQNESNTCQNEGEFCNMEKSNLSKWKNALFQNEQTNTKEYTKNNTKYIKPPLPSGIGVVKLKKQDEILREFLGNDYTDDYARRINNLLKTKGVDSAYLQEKIDIAKSKKLYSKCGYLYNALKYDYRESAPNFSEDFGNKADNFGKGRFENSSFGNDRFRNAGFENSSFGNDRFRNAGFGNNSFGKRRFWDERVRNRNKFINFEETIYKYTPEELEAKIEEHNRRKYGEIA